MPPEPQRPPAKEAHQQAQGGLQKTCSPLFQPLSRSKDRLALPPAEKRCEASKPCRRSRALQQRRRTNRHRADCKRPAARCFNPSAAARIGWLSRPPKSDAKRASHAAGAAPSSKGGAPTGTGRIAKDLEPAVSIPQPQQGSAGSPACQKRCEASKPCLRSHNALQQRRRTNRRRADCKRPGARCFNPAAAARIGWLSRLPEAMRSEQAMPPEPQPPLVKGARRQARGCGGQRARGPLFCTASAVRNNGAFPARQAGKAAEPACKPGSVVDSHSSRRHVTVTLEQPTRTRRGPRH